MPRAKCPPITRETIRDAADRAINEVRDEEAEACAKIAEEFLDGADEKPSQMGAAASLIIATIRARIAARKAEAST